MLRNLITFRPSDRSRSVDIFSLCDRVSIEPIAAQERRILCQLYNDSVQYNTQVGDGKKCATVRSMPVFFNNFFLTFYWFLIKNFSKIMELLNKIIERINSFKFV